ncbi:DUF6210 family protein [Actinoallomurus sp. NPDC052274]|uniref:DUF6210 family protein n=1 Tax=Actinoallomurus sp. NPDC052274 TaxID=3155420 RepID=UPI00342C26B4
MSRPVPSRSGTRSRPFIPDLWPVAEADLGPRECSSPRRAHTYRPSYYAAGSASSARTSVSEADDVRISEADEAWVPVRTPDGPGILVWCNSD